MKFDKILTFILSKYANFIVVFSKNLITKFLEYTGINDYAINLVKKYQLPYGPIYSQKVVKLESLKTYIETNLANGFIKPSNSPISAFVLFIKKFNDSFQLYVNYQNFNNLIIKN